MESGAAIAERAGNGLKRNMRFCDFQIEEMEAMRDASAILAGVCRTWTFADFSRLLAFDISS